MCVCVSLSHERCHHHMSDAAEQCTQQGCVPLAMRGACSENIGGGGSLAEKFASPPFEESPPIREAHNMAEVDRPSI